MKLGADDVEDVLALIESIGRLGVVSCCEARCYEWLTGVYWTGILERAKIDRHRLVFGRIGEGQLLVEWRGQPASERRVIFVVHVDREGYLVTSCDTGQTPVRLRAVQPLNIRSDRGRLGGVVSIRVGIRDATEVARGEIIAVDEPTREYGSEREPPGLPVEIAVTHELRDKGGIAAIISGIEKTRAQRIHTVTAHHVFERLQYKPFHRRGNVLEMDHVDNVAGVAVATAAVARAVLRELETNVGVLYTSGEELGLIGAFDACRDIAGWDTHALDNTVFVIVDCSNVVKSVACSSVAESLGYVDEKGPTCRTDVASVRLGDDWTRYHVGVSQLIQQCGLGVRYRRRSGDREPMHTRRDLADGSSWLGSAGFFRGGLCDAAVFQRAIRIWKGDEEGYMPRVGALAIPITNFRMVSRRGIEPEVTTVSAVVTALALAGEILAVHSTMEVASPIATSESDYRGYWGIPERVALATRAEMLENWRRYFEGNRDLGLRGVRTWWQGRMSHVGRDTSG